MMFEEYDKSVFNINYNYNYSISQLSKYMFRKGNHWNERIRLTFDLVNKLEIFGKNVLDLGTSIGTYAVEFTIRGYNVKAIDLDEKAIEIARKIAKKKGLNIDYKVGDISQRINYKRNTFDIIYAGDIIEHLPRPVLESTISNCFFWLKDGGYLVYHTVPLKYDVIFHKSPMWLTLVPFFFMTDKIFKVLVKADYSLFKIIYQIIKCKNYDKRLAGSIHCNLQTKESFQSILNQKGFINLYNLLCITEDRFKKGIKYILFKKKEYYLKDMFGIAWKPIYF